MDELPSNDCTDYKTYVEKVPFERIYLVFVAEDQTHPASVMGHAILKISGEDKEGALREHSFAFMALMNKDGNLERYLNAVLRGTNGVYALMPYQDTIDTYVHGENRSLWEFELKISDDAKHRLQKHLWELKETPILYQFITHNCNTAIEAILRVAGESFNDDRHFIFATPTEYLQILEERGLIKSVNVYPNMVERSYFKLGKIFYPLDAPSASRITIEGFDGGFRLNAAPSYRNILSVSNAGATEIKSEFLEIALRSENKKIRLETLNFIAIESIGDYRVVGLSKSFRLASDENKYNRLSGTFEWGRGFGISIIKDTVAYSITKIGIGYDGEINFYIAAKSGIIARFGSHAKLITDWTHYWDSSDRYRSDKLSAYAVYAPSFSWDTHIGLERYFHEYDYSPKTIFSVGFSRYF
ncbi:MAG: DUF4105 domain-containing protein [Campylobacteraceae bacterium]|jgi:hypothetical protein|nr:DUF4105 domain-containing protein [Campylobacteraceae bacterium]